uniref:hypothetical protein n=1 Tax=Streptomyces longwoodensis TaxID=68231 RepID=UPI002F911C84
MRSPTRRVPTVEEGGQGPALRFLAGDLPREDIAVDVRVDGGDEQAPDSRLVTLLGCLPAHRLRRSLTLRTACIDEVVDH